MDATVSALGSLGVAVAGVVGAVAVVVVLAFVGSALRRRRRRRALDRRLEKLLAGRALRDVLAASGYDCGHWQGEDAFRICERGSDGRAVAWAATEREAQLWILERAVSDAASGGVGDSTDEP